MLRIPPGNFLNIPPANDPFMMDFENYCLSKWDAREGIPTGRERWKDAKWAIHMQQELEDSDCTWPIYVRWVQEGGGDEWFTDPNSDDESKWTTDENKDCSNFTKTQEDPEPANFECTSNETVKT